MPLLLELCVCGVAQNEVRAVIFVVDSLLAHPREPDVQGLVRICNVHNAPPALDIAEVLLETVSEATERGITSIWPSPPLFI